MKYCTNACSLAIHVLVLGLSQVEVVHVASGERTVFDCHDWVDAKCGWQRLLSSALVLPGGINLATMMTLANMAITTAPLSSTAAAAAAGGGIGVGQLQNTGSALGVGVTAGGAAGDLNGFYASPFSLQVAAAAAGGGGRAAHGNGGGLAQSLGRVDKVGNSGGHVAAEQMGGVVKGHTALIGASSERGVHMQQQQYSLQHKQQQYSLQHKQQQQNWRQQQ